MSCVWDRWAGAKSWEGYALGIHGLHVTCSGQEHPECRKYGGDSSLYLLVSKWDGFQEPSQATVETGQENAVSLSYCPVKTTDKLILGLLQEPFYWARTGLLTSMAWFSGKQKNPEDILHNLSLQVTGCRGEKHLLFSPLTNLQKHLYRSWTLSGIHLTKCRHLKVLI